MYQGGFTVAAGSAQCLDRSGYCIWSKRLEQGEFNVGRSGADQILIDDTRLKMILEGIEAKKYVNTSVTNRLKNTLNYCFMKKYHS